MSDHFFAVESAQARVVKDSVSPQGIRLPTVQARYPRMVHADAKTHRILTGFEGELSEIVMQDISLLADEKLSRNGRSSRAVPVARLLEEAPYVPHFMKNKRGMQATEELTPEEMVTAERLWIELAEATKDTVRQLTELGVHKQWANRPLEWFGYIDVLITATDWENFFALRDHEAAQPEVQHLARAVKAALDHSEQTLLQPGEWHLPYVDDQAEIEQYGGLRDPSGTLRKLSVARCARLTIKPFDGDGSLEKELARYEGLVVSRPVHASPAEHQATPDVAIVDTPGSDIVWQQPALHANFTGYIQNRKTLPYEFVPG
ncbi:Thymidylate synthase complementing protein [Faunimonas pinastri]|uniref:Thymidylate synthase complementing protein n=1 Tax=Faunimonas pinastri TaxID=1855383 RepID=A0A1H9MYB6_9HYPH|nr:FAD-dependent thymidylate synthase [Faunimonas pinastri]SER28093.1 Thymidylate synthase complementing protein [Faunimonas pinastri]